MKTLFLMQILSGGLLAALSAAACAQPCDNILNALEREKDLALVQRAGAMQVTHYKASENIDLDVKCGLGKPNIGVYWAGPIPDQAFYDLVGRAGTLVSSRSAADVVKASKQCRQQALKDNGEIATVEQKGLAIECQAFARDGGGTTITVFAE
ncbi:hypothetical protein A7D21_17905 [Pseudomonas sp. AP19]|uniref:hypothetical protein n=1 Tax=Pseudomonas sp. AP19 TaxID=1535623 RepID=UPI00084A347A|nr:hypothetical protein [Pseudomonas sp. AP19]OEC69646.1 hypothetical protein A7D21_17905 [Pseudomonas sp. AP19]